jgi:hypothetical protein
MDKCTARIAAAGLFYASLLIAIDAKVETLAL